MTEAACLGAALLAGVGAGVFPDLTAAVRQTVHLPTRIEPETDAVVAYEQRFQLYRQVYPLLKDISRRI